MKKYTYESREDWLKARFGKITGTRVKDIVIKRGTGKKIGYYELIAERLATRPEDENPMDRGIRLESDAIQKFEEVTGKTVDTSLFICTREDNESIAYSPDGVIGDEETVEAKCLSSARHIEAYLTQKVPSEYEDQTIQPFVVNDKLKTLYLVFFDPRFPEKVAFFYLTITRESVEEKVAEYLEYERTVLKEVNEIVAELSF